MSMDIRTLATTDLNLLVALQVLLEERNVSRAAQRLFISQSAMSKTLGRLREAFDDPLFTRSGGEMVPTVRAVGIASDLSRVLQGAQAVIMPPVFNPQDYVGVFTVEIPEFIAKWAFPILLARLAKEAPGIGVSTVGGYENHLEAMAAGKLDFIVQAEQHHYEPEFKVLTLGYAPPRLFVRHGHPLEGAEPDWPQILSYPLVRMHLPDVKQTEAFYDKSSDLVKLLLGTPPILLTQHIPAALEVVKHTDAVFIGPPFFIQQQHFSMDVATLPFPGEEAFTVKFVLVYHERIAQSAPHQYLLSCLESAANTYRVNSGLPSLEEIRQKPN
jgi:DNA-binding transcriptional LysR family regulator